jgi:hypothetical protein
MATPLFDGARGSPNSRQIMHSRGEDEQPAHPSGAPMPEFPQEPDRLQPSDFYSTCFRSRWLPGSVGCCVVLPERTLAGADSYWVTWREYSKAWPFWKRGSVTLAPRGPPGIARDRGREPGGSLRFRRTGAWVTIAWTSRPCCVSTDTWPG